MNACKLLRTCKIFIWKRMFVDPSVSILEKDACKPLYHLRVICLWFSFIQLHWENYWGKNLRFSPIWDKVFKNGPNKVCGRQTIFHKFYLIHSWMFCRINYKRFGVGGWNSCFNIHGNIWERIIVTVLLKIIVKPVVILKFLRYHEKVFKRWSTQRKLLFCFDLFLLVTTFEALGKSFTVGVF